MRTKRSVPGSTIERARIPGACVSDSMSERLTPPVKRTLGLKANVTVGSNVSRLR